MYRLLLNEDSKSSKHLPTQRRNMKRADFMNYAQSVAMGNAPRTHENCRRLLKEAKLNPVNRPGKTAKDRALKGR
jgi:hypothetical protein